MDEVSRNIQEVADVLVENHGSIFAFQVMTPVGTDWIKEHVGADALFFGGALMVEPRYAWNLAEGMKDDGLVVA